MKTLNQIRQELTEFARQHGQILTAKFSRQTELLDGGDIKYPAFYYDLKPMRKQAGMLIMPFTGWVADRINPERDNQAEVWNDATLIALDIIGFLTSEDRDYNIQDGTPVTPFTAAGGDLTAGVSFDFTILIPWAIDRCITPLKPGGYLVTEDGTTITTEDGKTILIEG